MTRTDRQERERRFWNDHAQVDEYSRWQEVPYDEWRTWRPIQVAALDYLGPVTGKRLLMAGVGPQSVHFARAGAEVWGFDIAEAQIQSVQALVDRHSLSDRIHLATMAFEALDYPDGFFDAGFGIAILHHIDLRRGAAELARVLRPGGRASFIEPLGTNPLLEFARRKLPYPGKQRTDDERPLTYRDIRLFGRGFARSRYEEFGLVSMVYPRIVRSPSVGHTLHELDARILARARWMRPLCQTVFVGVETARA